MKPTYYKGFSITIHGRLGMKRIEILNSHTKETAILDIKPENCDTMDHMKFAKEFIDSVLLNNNALS